MIIFLGRRHSERKYEIEVLVDGKPPYFLTNRSKEFSADMLPWGYLGEGAKATAYSLLYECLGEQIAKDYWRRYLMDVVSQLDERGGFSTDSEEIKKWVDSARSTPDPGR